MDWYRLAIKKRLVDFSSFETSNIHEQSVSWQASSVGSDAIVSVFTIGPRAYIAGSVRYGPYTARPLKGVERPYIELECPPFGGFSEPALFSSDSGWYRVTQPIDRPAGEVAAMLGTGADAFGRDFRLRFWTGKTESGLPVRDVMRPKRRY